MTALELIIATLPFAYFMFVASVTPGPNNLMLAASGMNYGFRKTIPHMVGVAVGFGVLMFICAYGVGRVYEAYPAFRVALNICAAVYMVYLAYKIATSGKVEVDENGQGQKPFTFLEAALFQFVNPKGWVMALASAATFLPQDQSLFIQSLIILAMVFLINFPCVGMWTLFGQAMAKLFASDKARRIINGLLAIMLIATIPMMIIHK